VFTFFYLILPLKTKRENFFKGKKKRGESERRPARR